MCSFSLLKYLIVLYSAYHLNDTLYGFSLTDWHNPNCQHRYSCTLGPLLSKIRVPWTQALRHHGSQSVNRGSCEVTSRCVAHAVWTHWTKDGLCHFGAEWEGMKFHRAAQNNMQFKAYALFNSGTFHLVSLDCLWL